MHCSTAPTVAWPRCRGSAWRAGRRWTGRRPSGSWRNARGTSNRGGLPYRRWFDPFDRVLRAGLGVSYYDGTACHVNVVPWATDPVWRDLDRGAWARLLECDLPVVVEQLRHGGYRLVVVNGRTAMAEVAAAGLVEWTMDHYLDGPPAARLCVGESIAAVFVGWSCNLQNQPGAAGLATEIAAWLRAVASV